MSTLLIVVFATLCSLVTTPIVRRVAQRFGWVDRPDGGRKAHTEPIPRVGGLAIYASFVFSSGLFLVSAQASDPWYGAIAVHAYRHLVIACGLVMAVGLADDLYDVKPWVKLAVQTTAAYYMYIHGYRIEAISNPFGGGSVAMDVFSLPLTLLWFVGMSNAFNLIDGLDGLAAGIGLFSTTTLFIAATVNQRWEVTLLCAALAGSLAGFLRYNFFPANIFLGDSGALLIGFALAAFAIRGSMKSSAAVAVAAPLLALAIPIVDSAIALVRRLIAGKNPFKGDSDHIHHRLVRRGLRPRNVVILLYAIAGGFGALSLLTMNERGQMAGLVIIATSVVTWVGIQHLGYPEFGEIHRILRKNLLYERQAIGNNVFLRSLQPTFAEAPDLNVFWTAAVEMAVRLDCISLQVVLDPASWSAASLAAVHGPLPSDFPRWGRSTQGEDSDPWLTWSVPLPAGRGKTGHIVLTKRFDPAPSSFDNGCLLEVLERSLAPNLIRLLSEAPLPSAPPGETLRTAPVGAKSTEP